MTSLFGACDLAAPSNTGALADLLRRMGSKAADAVVVRAQAPTVATEFGAGVALGLCQRAFGDSAPELRIERHDHLWLVFAGRLDHRGELERALTLPVTAQAGAGGAPSRRCTDAAVVMAAYRQFGCSCVDRLSGDWVFALWDARDRRMVLARDATGISSLYWWSGGGQLLFASSLPVLLAAPPVPKRPDPSSIAGLLSVFVDSARPAATAFQGVFALPPGHLMIAAQGRCELQRWWHPEQLQRLYDENLDELQERFLAQYRQAVLTVLPPSGRGVAATLSGGLDSGSVVALAAPVLAQTGQRLTAYVHTPRFEAADDHPDRTTNEWQLASATARHVGNIDMVACRSEQVSPLDGIRQWLDMATVPSHAAGNWYWMLDIANLSANAGAQVLLMGQAGNSTVSFTGDGSLWPRVRRLQWAMAGAELRRDNGGITEAVKTRLLKPALRPAYHWIKRALASHPPESSWHDYSLVHPRMAQETGLLAAMRADGHDPGFSTMSPASRTLFRLTLRGGTQNGSAVWSELGQFHGLEVCDPTRDRKLVELCWRLPDELFWAQGQQRGLVRRTMRTALPAQVLVSSRRGQQSADLRQRLQACAPEFLAEVDRVCRHPIVREWIDAKRFSHSARAVLDSQPAHRKATTTNISYLSQHVLRTLAAAMFVMRHS